MGRVGDQPLQTSTHQPTHVMVISGESPPKQKRMAWMEKRALKETAADLSVRK